MNVLIVLTPFYTDFNCYVSQTFNIIKTDRFNLKYITAILNSKLVSFWLFYSGKMQGGNYQVDKEPLLNIPIKSISAKEEIKFAQIVDKINSAKTDEVNSDISQFESELNHMAYSLYGLTSEEIKVVEGAF